MTATSEIASSLRDIPVTIQAGNHGVLKQSNSISNHFPIGAPVAHRPRRAQRGLPTNAASRVLNLGNRCWIFFKHAKNRAAGQKNSRFADQFAKYCRHVCCAFEHREVAAGGERSTRTMSRTKVFRMAMGQRKHEEQTGMWVAVSELAKSVSHPFYEKLNRLLAEYGFDDFVETKCRPFYAEKIWNTRMGPDSLRPTGEITAATRLLRPERTVPLDEIARKVWLRMIQDGLLGGKTSSELFSSD